MAPPLRFPRLQWFYPQQPTDDDLPKLNPIDCSADAPVPCNDITSNSDRFRWWWAFGGNRYDAETGDAFFCCHRRSDKICRIIWCSFQTTGFSFYLQSLSLSPNNMRGRRCKTCVSDYTFSKASLTDWLTVSSTWLLSSTGKQLKDIDKPPTTGYIDPTVVAEETVPQIYKDFWSKCKYCLFLFLLLIVIIPLDEQQWNYCDRMRIDIREMGYTMSFSCPFPRTITRMRKHTLQGCWE